MVEEGTGEQGALPPIAVQASTGSPLMTLPSLSTYLPEGGQDYESVTMSQEVVSLTSSTIINQKAFANNLGIPVGAVVNCMPPSATNFPLLRQSPVCCSRCGAYINPYCRVEVSTGQWTCNFCGQQNATKTDMVGEELQVSAELTSEAVDYVEESPLPESSLGEEVLPTGPVLFLLDSTIDVDDAVSVKEAVAQVLRQLHPDTPVAIISLDACVSVHNLGTKPGILESHTLPGQIGSLHPGARALFLGACPKFSKIGSCLPTAESIVQSLTPYRPDLVAMERPRCLGPGLHEALHLMQDFRNGQSTGDQSATARRGAEGRVMALVGGGPTHGPGAVALDAIDKQGDESSVKEGLSFFARLAAMAHGAGIPVDIFAVGPAAGHATILEPFSRASGGNFTMHTSVTSQLLAMSMTASLDRQFGSHGILDVRLSHGLKLAAIIGSVAGPLRPCESGVRKLSSNACSVGSMDAGKSFGLWVEATRDFGQEELILQVIMAWTDRLGGKRDRVVTRRIVPTGNLNEYLRSIHAIPASVLLAKKIVLELARAEAAHSIRRSEDVRMGLSAKLTYLGQKFGKLLEKKATGFLGLGLQQKWSCPQELGFVAQTLYHLQRSTMLTPYAHVAERSLLHSVFLACACPMAERMLVPKMYELDPALFIFREIPPLDIALRSDTAVLLDHGAQIFVWVGREVARESGEGLSDEATSMVETCERKAVELSKGRCPIPELQVVVEGHPKMRHVLVTVVPAHKDADIDRKLQFSRPVLGSELNWKYAMAGSPMESEPSFYQWCRNASVEPPRQDLSWPMPRLSAG
ncbi:unnamed protein product [Ostreobium quekettii]|uniref:Protein transport protein SEC23 n=1 Tax=Ostreobium quekettii TaxID=121088 RepID=A0A8S1J8C6_9CHLO|nr:unnamed protein product [Ostreobium quekettii]|eukprot:evm.model.scf_1447.5 EVM.evm.TU.scf_1447.5   scf_1447:22904-28596(+)